MNITISIESRMTSQRLPGKAMKDVVGAPALGRLIERMKRVHYATQIVVATTTNREDDPVASLCDEHGISCFRGSEHDVLDRVYQAHRSMNSDLVVQVWGDCLLLDPALVDLSILQFLHGDYDLVAPSHEAQYPHGQSCYVFRFERLEWLHEHARTDADREHVSIHFQSHAEQYRILRFPAPEALRAPDLWMAMDEQVHLDYIRSVYAALLPTHPAFGLKEILALQQADDD